MTDIVRLDNSARLSRVVIFNGLVMLCGQTADDRSEDVNGQAWQVLAKIDNLLAEAGTDKCRLLSAHMCHLRLDGRADVAEQ